MTTKTNGFKGSDPSATIAKIMARKSGDTFVREQTAKGKSRKTAKEQKDMYVKEGILAALYARHVLGQQLELPGADPAMGGGMGMPQPGMDPAMMGGMGVAPPMPPQMDPNAQGLY